MRVGDLYKTNDGSILKIIEYNSWNDILIEFQDEFRFRRKAQSSNIKDGKVSNPYAKTVYGVGMIGLVQNPSLEKIYVRWQGMLERCYVKKSASYENYGGKGVVVCEEWKIFENYLKDISNMENYDKLLKDSANWHVDKDLKGGMVYSKDTCSIIPASENSSLGALKNKKPHIREKARREVCQYNLDGQFVKEYESVTEAINQTGFTGIKACLSGRTKTSGNYIWKYKEKL